MHNLYKMAPPSNEKKIILYADESKPHPDSPWLYIAILAVTADEWTRASQTLENERKGYQNEIRFQRIGSPPEGRITASCDWLSAILGGQNGFYFHILGIDLENLNKDVFGNDRKRIYNRFFRSAVLYVLNGYFSDVNRLYIDSIYHDRTNDMEEDDYFNWHLLWKLDREHDRIKIGQNRIRFIDSDHNIEKIYPEHSHFIQFTDLILGATRQCIECRSNNQNKIKVAQIILPLIERLTDKKRYQNKNSRYEYFKRCSISFFPKERLNLSQLDDPSERYRSGFYVGQPLRLLEKVSGAQKLFSLNKDAS